MPDLTQDELLEHEARRRAEDLKWLMSHEAGRRIVWRWLEDAGVFRNPFNNSGSVTAFNCGQQNMGQRLMAEVLEQAPEQFTRMLKEHKN